jgi:hypothetical protein
MFFVLKFELILIIGSNNVLTEGARKVYRGRRVGQGCCILYYILHHIILYVINQYVIFQVKAIWRVSASPEDERFQGGRICSMTMTALRTTCSIFHTTKRT